jgi:para-aminobenzoate synthetase component I
MWSDRLPPEDLRLLVNQIRSVVSPASIEQWNSPGPASHSEPGFAWLNGLPLSKPLAIATYSKSEGVVSGPQGSVRLRARGFDLLEALLTAWHGAPALLAGFLSYDLAAELEDLGSAPPESFQFPQFHFGLYKNAPERPVEDAIGGRTLVRAGLESRWASEAEASRGLKPALHPTPSASVARRPMEQSEEELAPISSSCPLTSRPSRACFEAAVERIVAAIHAGDFFQTNLCRSLETRLRPGSEWDLFQRLRRINPARYEAFLRVDPERAVLSVSPETFLKVQNGVVESSPIKGTRPRGRAGDQDAALARELLASEKDRAELAMIVDVTRNDLGRVCETGSVEVIQHASLMSLPTVHHLFSTVGGKLRPSSGLVDLLRAAFPAASITGAPKIEAMRAALREEGQWRGPCMGAIGWISLGLPDSMELSVAIRTAFVSEGRVRYYAGCGITADSIPASEFLESRHKAAAFVRGLDRQDDPNW